MTDLFVYGTLRSDGPRGGLLADCKREPATVMGELYALPAGYPAMVAAGDTEIRGELVFGVDERKLRVIDMYEGVDDGLYRRVEVVARLGLDRIPCLAYVMDRPWERGGRRLPNGWWVARDR